MRRAETDAGQRPGSDHRRAGPAQRAGKGELELRRANEILKAASAFFARELDPRPPQIVAFIDEHRHRFGVEPICRVLTEHGCKIAPNTYWVAKKRPPSARSVRDEELKGEIAPGLGREPRGLWGRQGLDPAQPGGHPRGPLHRRAPDA